MKYHLPTICLIVLSLTCTCHADLIQFETNANLINFGTYSESGYTFTQSSFQVNVEDPGVGSDGRLVFRTFTNGSPGVRMTNDADQLFDLLSLDVDEYGILATFTATASSGASFTFGGVGSVDFTSQAGDWTNLSFVDFQYSGPASSEMISLDNLRTSLAVPEPASACAWLVGLTGVALTRRRRTRR